MTCEMLVQQICVCRCRCGERAKPRGKSGALRVERFVGTLQRSTLCDVVRIV